MKKGLRFVQAVFAVKQAPHAGADQIEMINRLTGLVGQEKSVTDQALADAGAAPDMGAGFKAGIF